MGRTEDGSKYVSVGPMFQKLSSTTCRMIGEHEGMNVLTGPTFTVTENPYVFCYHKFDSRLDNQNVPYSVHCKVGEYHYLVNTE